MAPGYSMRSMRDIEQSYQYAPGGVKNEDLHGVSYPFSYRRKGDLRDALDKAVLLQEPHAFCCSNCE